MQKVILLSVVVALFAIPIFAAGAPNPRRGLKQALLGVLAFNLFYAFVLRVVIPRLG